MGADRLQHVPDMVPNRFRADVQLRGDLFRGAPAFEELEHLCLTGREV
jgi:hypothetical protein